MKKKFIGVLVYVGLLLAGCSVLYNNNAEGKIKGVKNEIEEKLVTQAVLGLSNMNINTRKNAQRSFNEDEVKDIQNVLSQVDVFLSKGETLHVEKSKSNKEGYSNRMDLSFDEQEISLFYNSEENKSYRDEDEVVTITTFSGIALYNNYEYQFNFVNEEENGFDEQETKTTLKIYENETSYVEISQETEEESFSNEVSYSYKKVENKNLVLDFELSISNEYNQQEVDVEINGVEYSFEYVTILNKEYIQVELENRSEREVRGYFEKVVTKNEDGTVTTTFVFVNP